MLSLPEIAITPNSIHHMDLFALCNAMGSQSVDMVLCDLPYGTTACSWDTIIPMKPMWAQFKRIIKPRGAIVLTASQPFTSILVGSNLDMFRHEWIWQKSLATGYLNANIAPMKAHESVIVYSKSKIFYVPQMIKGKPYTTTSGSVGGYVKDKTVGGYITENNGERYPRSIIEFNSPFNKLHPTQKPVKLFEYLIKTYTLPGQLVFDPCVGSGTTALAAQNTDRQYICGDFTRDYVEMARSRVKNSDPYQPSIKKNGMKQLSLFGS